MVPVEAELATWLKFLIVAAVLAFSALVFKTLLKLPLPGLKQTSVKTLAAFSLAALAASVFFLFIGWRFDEQVHPISQISTSAPKSEIASDPSLDALWDKLTKSIIDLGDEAASTPSSEDKAVKEAVGKTFGLGENKQLPPPWVTTPPKWVGQVYRESVSSDPFVSEEECRRQLETVQIPQSVARRIEQLASAQVGHEVKVVNPFALGIGLDYIFREVCRDDFTGTVDSSVGEMKKTHVLLEYNPSVDKDLVEAWLRTERHARLESFGTIAGLSLCGLAAVYGLLRFDTWSRGYYTKQLIVGGVLGIIAVVVFVLKA